MDRKFSRRTVIAACETIGSCGYDEIDSKESGSEWVLLVKKRTHRESGSEWVLRAVDPKAGPARDVANRAQLIDLTNFPIRFNVLGLLAKPLIHCAIFLDREHTSCDSCWRGGVPAWTRLEWFTHFETLCAGFRGNPSPHLTANAKPANFASASTKKLAVLRRNCGADMNSF